MPQRNDSTLYTGMSVAIQRTIERNERKREGKRTQSDLLKPAEQRLRDFIDNQKVDQMKQLAAIVDMSTDTEDIKSELLAIKKNLVFIDNFKKMVDTMLRINQRQTSPEELSDE